MIHALVRTHRAVSRVGTVALLALAVGASAPACSKGSPARGSGPHPESGKLGADTRKLLEAVPAGAAFVGYIDSPESFWDQVVGGDFLIRSSEQTRKALDAELRAYIKQRAGLDVSRFKTAVLFGDPQTKTVGVVVQGIAGKLPGKPAGTHQDAALLRVDEDVVLAQRGDITVLGNEPIVRATLDVIAGKAKGMVAEATPLWTLIDTECSGAFIGVAMTPADAPIPELQAMSAQFGVTDGCLFLGRTGLRAVIRGDGAKLKGLADMARQAMQMGLQQLEAEKQKATAPGAPVPEGVGAIIAYHRLKDLIAQLEPRVSGGRLEVSVSIDAGEPMLLVSLVGVAAAVAVPAFMKYEKKSKTAEAAQFIKKMHDGARAYYMEPPQPGLTPRAPGFPPSVGPTPPVGACCAQGGKCAPDAAQWDDPAWTALMFSVDDPHYYSYQFINNGTEFTARAIGDLDCDGVYATFEMTGALGPDGGSAALRRVNELE